MSDTKLEDVLPEDYPERKFLVEHFGTVGKLAEEYRNQKAFVQSTVRAPVHSKDPEDWRAFYRKLGAPESEDGYSVPDGDATFKAIAESMRTPALESGVLPDQWNRIIGKAGEKIGEITKQVQQAPGEWREEARQIYGDDLDAKIEIAEETFSRMVGDENVLSALKAAGVTQNTNFMKAMLDVNQNQQNDQIPAGGSPEMGPDFMALAARCREISKTAEFNDRHHPDNEKLVTEFYHLSAQIRSGGFDGPADPKLEFSPFPGFAEYNQPL